MSDADVGNVAAPAVLQEMPHDAVRRRITVAAFGFLLVTGAGMIGVGLISDVLAARVNTLAPLANNLDFVMAGIVGAYFGVGGWERIARIRNQ